MWTKENQKGPYKMEVRGSKSAKEDVKREPEVGVMCFENGERDNELKNAGGLEKLGKARKLYSPTASRRNPL